MLSPLVFLVSQVLEARFEESRLVKERAAVLSEMSMVRVSLKLFRERERDGFASFLLLLHPLLQMQTENDYFLHITRGCPCLGFVHFPCPFLHLPFLHFAFLPFYCPPRPP